MHEFERETIECELRFAKSGLKLNQAHELKCKKKIIMFKLQISKYLERIESLENMLKKMEEEEEK